MSGCYCTGACKRPPYTCNGELPMRSFFEALTIRQQNAALKYNGPDTLGWTEQDVKDYYDSHLMVTLRELSNMSGYSIEHLKEMLMAE
jgi:hypothetical protein